MSYAIKEMRESTGMTQKEFAEMYGIPVSTLRKWEQHESTPAPYVVSLIARSLPYTNSSLRKIKSKDGKEYFYDHSRKMVSDAKGNWIRINEDLNEIKEQNLPVYLRDLFAGFYEIQDKFNRDCVFDKQEDIIWS